VSLYGISHVNIYNALTRNKRKFKLTVLLWLLQNHSWKVSQKSLLE